MKKSLFITLAVAIIIAAIAYIAGSQSKDNDKVSAKNSNISANIQLYSNTEAGYSLEYPQDWTFDNGSNGNPAMFYDSVALQSNATDLIEGSKIEIYYEDNNFSSLGEAAENKDNGSEVLLETTVNINNLQAIYRTENNLLGDYTNVVYMINDGMLYTIVQYIPVDSEIIGYTKVFDEFIESFQFVK